MARKPRIHFPGAFYHVTLRGNGGAEIFFDDADRCRFLLLLQHCCERFGCRVHAFCLMPNHLHLALQIDTIPLSRIMQNLAFRYAQWLNMRRQCAGHLFQGRYQSVVMNLDEYLLQLTAYLHLNPVRAGLVESAEDYPWSSHQAYLGRAAIPWLTTGAVLAQLSPDHDRAQQLFGEYLAKQRALGYRKELHGGQGPDGRVAGKEPFVKQVLRRAGQQTVRRPGLELVWQTAKEVFGVTDKELRRPGQGRRISEIRALLAWAVLELSDATLEDLSRMLGRDPSTLSSAVRRLREKSLKNHDLAEKMEQLQAALTMFATLQA